MERILKRVILIIAIILVSQAAALADCPYDCGVPYAGGQPSARFYCSFDCADAYARGIRVCRLIHHNPLDAGDLSICVGNSQGLYNKCLAGCVYEPEPAW
jgi:hypothetical protein